MRLLFYYKKRQTFITKWVECFTIKCNSYYKIRQFYDKIPRLLQKETFNTKCVGTHPSIKKIKKKIQTITKFARQAVKDITLGKSSSSDIKADITKQYDLCFQALTNCINKFKVSGTFLELLKLSNISPVYKAKDSLEKNNCISVSILPLWSRIYQRFNFDQLYLLANKALSKFLLFGFRNSLSK